MESGKLSEKTVPFPPGVLPADKDNSKITRHDFPDGFLFGSATSAYQVEGAAAIGGKSISVWDDLSSRNPGGIDDQSNGNVAADMYHKFKEDIRMMKQMGFDSYRFSISWTRVLPGGRWSAGVNREGIDFYNDVIDTILKYEEDIKAVRRAIDFMLGWFLDPILCGRYPENMEDSVPREAQFTPHEFETLKGFADKNIKEYTYKASQDQLRVKYYQDHLAHLLNAMKKEQVIVEGYFAWSWCDNFEWKEGYKVRFGIIYVDFNNNQTRYPKLSAMWFTKFLKARKMLKAVEVREVWCWPLAICLIRFPNDATCDLIGAPLREVLSALAPYEPHGFVLKRRLARRGGLGAYKPLKLLVCNRCGTHIYIIAPQTRGLGRGTWPRSHRRRH
ncbi:Beta-glucosidase 13 [Sesamum angolense]|uniref:Beta-glucosidase 13 n=1 Tax=Sesamum angolense TaxID=2727404 RepID=A0AAE1T7A2_9LAMI|nr:Beta-glucosidase 13 [Sesamum angolense]